MRDSKIVLVLASGLSGLLTAVIYAVACVLLWLIFEKIDSMFLRLEADEGFLRGYALAFQMIIGVFVAWIAGAFGFGLALHSSQSKIQPEILWKRHSLQVGLYSFAGYAVGIILGLILSVLALQEDSHKKFSLWSHTTYSGFALDNVDSTLAFLGLSGLIIGIVLASAKLFNEINSAQR